MIAYGMLYAVAVGLPILLAAIACSAVLRRYGRPERGVWLVALALALILPVAFLITAVRGTSSGVVGTLAEPTAPAMASGPPLETGVLGLPAVVALPVETSGLGFDGLVVLAWLLTSLVLSLRWAVAVVRLAQVGSSWRVGMVDGVRVWLTSDLGPAVSGILRTRILVPSWLMSLPEEQRSLVLLHEKEHVRARDPVLMAVSRIVRIVAPWNPVVWLLSSRLLHAVELDCDRRVLGRRPDIGTYGDTLLTVSARDSSPLVAAAAFAESEVPLRKRIIAITTPPRAVSVLGVLTVLTLGFVLLIGSCEVPVPIVLDPEGALESESQNPVLDISVERDGSVRVNGRLYPMSAVSAVLAPPYARYEAGVEGVSIRADDDVPYQVMDQLQQELVAAGMRRVRFQTVDSLTFRTPVADEPTLVDRGLALALGTVGWVYEALESLTLRSSQTDVPARVRQGLPILLPEQGGAVQVDPRSVMHLTVLPDGIVAVRRGVSLQVQAISPRDVASVWRQDVAQNPSLIASVETHPDTPYRYMVEVLDALRSANAERISLQVLEN